MPNFRWTLTNTIEGTEVLTTDPFGWDEIELFIRRDQEYHGMFHEFSFDLEFFCNGGGRDFIDNIYETQGIDAQVTLLIEYKCNESDDFEELFDGKLNFARYSRDRDFVRVNIEQNDIDQLVKNRGDIKINMNSLTSLDGSALNAYTWAEYNFLFHSKVIRFTSEIEPSAFNYTEDNINAFATTGIFEILAQPSLDLQSNELKSTVKASQTYDTLAVTGFNQGTTNHFHDTAQQVNDQIIFPQTYTIDFEFKGTFNDLDLSPGGIGRDTLSTNWQLMLVISEEKPATTAGGDTLALIPAYSVIAGNDHTDTFDVSGTLTKTINALDKIWLVWDVAYNISSTTGGNLNHQWIYEKAKITLTSDTTTTATTGRAWAIHEAYARICESITDQPTKAFKSDFFGRTNSQPTSYFANGCGSFTTITNGMQMRLFDAAEHPLFVSLNELFKGTNTIYNLGLGIEDDDGTSVVRIEEKEYFYGSSVLVTIDNVDDLKMRVDENLFWNQIRIGYNVWNPENVGGIDEFNTFHEYNLPITNTDLKLEADTDAITGSYAIETTRRKWIEPSKDWKFDNELFIIATMRGLDGIGNPDELDEAEKDENFVLVADVISPATIYNLRFAPVRCLLRWMNVISGGLIRDAGAEVKFQNAEGNFDTLTTMTADGCPGDFSGVAIDSDQDIAWDDAFIRNDTPLWIPEIYTFTAPLSYTDYKTIRDASNGVIEFSQTDENHIKGYLMELKFKLSDGMAEFTLLRKYE